MTKFTVAAIASAATLMAALPASAELQGQAQVVERSKSLTPSPPWSAGDERGMANRLGAGTLQRCAFHLGQSGAKSYEVSHIRSNTMPLSPFSVPYKVEYRGTASIPGTKHAFNGEHLKSGEPGAQGTQIDALGHFAHLAQPWNGKPPIPVDTASYYGGFKQADVKPSANSPLLKLGMEKAPPIVTTAVLLDAKTHLGGGKAMTPGQLVTANDIEGMLKAQGLAWRGILPGDVLYVYTGWSDNWADPDVKKTYYSAAPGLSYDAAKYIARKGVVLVALDAPFVDAVNTGQLMGKAPPAKGTPPGMPFVIHHHFLTQAGIHNVENANLAALAADKVWTSCTMILPLRSKGGHGSPIRPVSIGVPNQ
jgi:kynurenine formamidase